MQIHDQYFGNCCQIKDLFDGQPFAWINDIWIATDHTDEDDVHTVVRLKDGHIFGVNQEIECMRIRSIICGNA